MPGVGQAWPEIRRIGPAVVKLDPSLPQIRPNLVKPVQQRVKSGPPSVSEVGCIGRKAVNVEPSSANIRPTMAQTRQNLATIAGTRGKLGQHQADVVQSWPASANFGPSLTRPNLSKNWSDMVRGYERLPSSAYTKLSRFCVGLLAYVPSERAGGTWRLLFELAGFRPEFARLLKDLGPRVRPEVAHTWNARRVAQILCRPWRTHDVSVCECSSSEAAHPNSERCSGTLGGKRALRPTERCGRRDRHTRTKHPPTPRSGEGPKDRLARRWPNDFLGLAKLAQPWSKPPRTWPNSRVWPKSPQNRPTSSQLTHIMSDEISTADQKVSPADR